MFVVGLLQWWYGAGWLARARLIGDRLTKTFDYFSIDLLLKTWFSPFRQISAGGVRGPLGVQLRAWFDRLISRLIGAGVRTVMIVIGLGWILIQSALGVIELLTWLILPVFPVLGAIMMTVRWTPSWL